MLGLSKGGAIRYVKAINWATRKQEALQKMMLALNQLDGLLGYLSQSHWWVPDDIEGLAKDLRPLLKSIRDPLKKGFEIGYNAMHEFVLSLVGEDAARVAELAMANAALGRQKKTANRTQINAASTSKNKTKPAPKPSTKKTPTSEQHKKVAQDDRQHVEPGKKKRTSATLAVSTILKKVGTAYKSVIGEHMSDYHHMAKYAPNAWDHGTVKNKSKTGGKWHGTKKIVTKTGADHHPTELVPEHASATFINGIDAIWSMGGSTYHFVEAKASESAGALYGRADRWTAENNEEGGTRNKDKLSPPRGLSERQVALWYLLGQPNKGLQMGKDWIRASTLPTMVGTNLSNRFVYLLFAIPSTAKPPKYPYNRLAGMAGELKKGMAAGMDDHVRSSYDILECIASNGNVYDLALHDPHKAEHGISDSFTAKEVDYLDEKYTKLRLLERAKPTKDISEKPSLPKPTTPKGPKK